MARALVVASLALASCSAPCEEREGRYSATFERRTGNCGDSVETIMRPGTRGGVAPGCRDLSKESKDNCKTSAYVICELDAGTIIYEGVVNWSQDGADGEGFVEISSSGSYSCQGTYDVYFRQL